MQEHSKYHNGRFQSNGKENGSYKSIPNRWTESDDNSDIDLKQVFYTFWNRKWFIVSSVLVFAIVALIIAFLSTPIYQSEGTILIENSSGTPAFNAGGLGQILSSSYGLGLGSTLANELQILKSRKLSKIIAGKLRRNPIMKNGRQYPVLFRSYPDDSSMTSLDTVATRIREHVVFSEVDRKADVIQVTYESPSPYEAAKIVNLTMNSYNGLSKKQNRSSASSAVSFLSDKKQRIKNDLQAAEQDLREFTNESHLIHVETQTQELIEQIADLEARRQASRAMLVTVNAAIEQYKQQLNEIKPGLAEQYAKAIGPNIGKLQFAKSELELRKIRLLIKNPNLTNSSPQIEQLNQKIELYGNQIRELTQNLISKSEQYIGFLGGSQAGIAKVLSDLNQKMIELQVQRERQQAKIEVTSTQLAELEAFFNNLPDNIIDLAKLKRDVKINEELYIAVSKQLAQMRMWEQTQFGMGQIIDRGYIPKEPVKPSMFLYLLAGLFLGSLVGFGYVYVDDTLSVTIDGVEDMRKLKEPMLAAIPVLDVKEKPTVQGKNISPALITLTDSISPASESFRRLESNLIYSNPDSKIKSVMVTSASKGEGKTTTISNVGVVLAEAGYNTVIVDTDFRRPNLHNMFGLSKTPGFVEILFEEIGYEEGVQQTVAPGLSILSSGRRPPNAAAITQSSAFLNLLKNLENDFDFVLIDTPPFGIITDASAMLRQVDGVFMVAKFAETTTVQLNQTLQQLHHLNANIVGTVLTSFDADKSSDYQMGSKYYKEVYKDYNAYQEER